MGSVFKKNGSWWINYRANGKRHRKKIGTKADAQAALSQVESRIVRDEFGIVDNKYPLDDLIDEIMKRKKLELEPTTYKSYETQIQTLRREGFRDRRVETILLKDVDAYCEKRLHDDGVSVRRVNMEVGLLKRLLKQGVERGLIGWNPLSAWKELKGKPRKVRKAMTPDQVDRFLDQAQEFTPRLYPVWLCFLTTLMRREELVYLTWHQVDLDEGVICLEAGDTKTDEDRIIPIHPDLHVELQKLKLAAASGQQYVFVTKNGTPHRNNLYRAFRRGLRRAGFSGEEMKYYDIHSLRVTGITQFARERVHPKVVQRISGHKDIRMVLDIYTKVTDEECRAAMNKLSYGGRLGHPVGTRSKNVS